MNLKYPSQYETLKLSVLFVLYNHPELTVHQLIQYLQKELSYGRFVGITTIMGILNFFEEDKYVSSRKIDDDQKPQNGRKLYTLTNYGSSSMKRIAQELKAHQAAEHKALLSASLRERIHAHAMKYLAGTTVGYDVSMLFTYMLVMPFQASTLLVMPYGKYRLLFLLMFHVFVAMMIRTWLKKKNNEKALHHISNAQY